MTTRISNRRLTLGCVQLYIEPRDAWVGVFVGHMAVYVLLVPFLVVRWDRRPAERMARKAGFR